MRRDEDGGILTWRGHVTVQAALERLARGERTAIVLPANFHHALVARLHPAETGPVQHLDVRGGAELLRTVAAVNGLEALVPLADAAAARACTVRVHDPATLVIEPAASQPG